MKANNHFSAVILLIALFITTGVASLAQRGPGYGRMQAQREKIEAQKVAFITDKVDLTPEEAQVFWPVYNANRDKIEEEQTAFRSKYRLADMDLDKITDEEASERLDAQLQHDQKMLNMRKDFNEELKKILPPQKILKLIKAEQQFKLELMRKVAGPGGPPSDRP
ncbi:MAG: hypothetical protein KQI35_10395 [Bacteroidetes bacterium]|nr:hypothetical protein [Bacteroidota bacterium]